MKQKIGILAGPEGKPRFLRREAAEIAKHLSPRAAKLLLAMATHKPFTSRSKAAMDKVVNEVIKKGLLRRDVDIISKSKVFVLEKCGRWVCDVLQGKSTPKPRKTKAEKIHSQLIAAGEVPKEQAEATAEEIQRQVKISQSVLDALACPNCGGAKRQGFTVDQKCWYSLPEELRHPLMKRSVETQQEFMLRHPSALLAALEYLKQQPTQAAAINKKAREIATADVPYHSSEPEKSTK